MDVCTRVYNQSAISYFKSKNFEAKDDHWVDRLSSDIEIPTQKRNDGWRSTKKWALKTFYSDSGAAKHVSTLAAPDDDKPSAPSTPARDHKSSAPSTDHQTQTPANKLTQETRPELSIRFQEYLISSHAEKFKFCLVGKFNHKRPKLSLIRKWASNKWALKGKWSVTLLDPLHILISLENDDDMLLIWTRQKWIIDGHFMNVFKWSPNLQSERETSSAAVWVSFPFLPVVFFQEDLLLSIASLVGKVIAVDGQTRNLTRTDVARLWVEVDLCKDLPNKLWIGIGNSGFWQAVSYKKLPSYCANCRLQGHSTNRCKLNKNKLHFGIKNWESKVKEETDDNDDSCRKWAQFRSLFQDVEEDRILSLNLPSETSITKGDGWKKSRTKKIVSNEAFCQRRAEIFNEEEEEEGAFKTEESLRPHLGIEEQGLFPRASNLEQVETMKTMSEEQEQVETMKTMSEEQYSTKAEFNNENEKGRQDQVQKEGDSSDIGKKNLKISSENQDKNWESIMEENNNKSLEEIAPIRSISTEQQIFRQEKEEKERKERNSSQVEEVISNNDRFPMRIQYMEASNDFEPRYLKRYNFADVKKMTKSFRTEIGRGGFGTVFRGKLCDGRVVALKVPHVEGTEKEFDTELKIIGTSHHVNIVKPLGFCSEFSKRALIYEFMPNGSLDKYVGLPKSLGSKQLHQIAIGVAQGLDYLHNGRKTSVLHLDIKPANILLDKDFCPKICDFGLAKEWKRGEEQPFEATRGTHGYIAPEHFIGSSISSKSDVYSFGVMLLEMGVGKRILSHKRLDLLTWVRENLNHQQQQGILKDDISRKMIVVGLWCVQADPVNRPSTGRVVKMLQGKIEDLLPRNNLSVCLPPGTTPQFNQKPSEIVEIADLLIAEHAKSRVEGERLRKLCTLKGQVESIMKLKGLDMDTVEQHYSV